MAADPSGLREIWDTGFIALDGVFIGNDIKNNDSWGLAIDVACLIFDAFPGTPGASGVVVHGGTAAIKAAKVARAARAVQAGVKAAQFAGHLQTAGMFDTHTFAKRGPKTNGAGPHNQVIADRIQEIQKQNPTWTFVGGGGIKAEHIIPTPKGSKVLRRVDITFLKADGKYYYEQVGKRMTGKRTTGQPVPREVEASRDIEQETGIKPVFTPYN